MENQPKILNDSRSMNYVCGNKVFILGKIDDQSCCELIGNLSNLVDSLQWVPMHEQNGLILPDKNPYKLQGNANIPVIDIYINSGGGSIPTTKSILTLLNLARTKGAIIRTTVMGYAASCASVLAVQGTPDFRIMYEHSYNLVHYGSSTYTFTHPEEVENVSKYEPQMRKDFYSLYSKYTNLTKSELKKAQNSEYNFFSAKESMAKNMCDWILTSDGKFIKRNQNTR